jgi:uncharacterized membrane protein YjgN (DUF898 family)
MLNKEFEFRGTGLGYFWTVLWTTILTFITFGLAFPWAYSAQQRWIAANTYVNSRQLVFTGTGIGFIWQWLVIIVLIFVTFGLYTPWAYCRLKRWETDNLYFADSAAYSPVGAERGINR